MERSLILVLAIFALLGLVGLYATFMYNRMIRGWELTREAWSGIDVQLRRRTSLIPNLVQAVGGYATHERGVFEEVARARGGLERAKGPAESAGANQILTQALGRLLAVVERYPELQASKNFQDLQDDLYDIEEKIAFARQFYNANVLDYNNRLQTVPTVFIANTFGFLREAFFEADEEGRAEVRVDFTGAQPAPAAPASGDTTDTQPEQPGQQTP